MEHSPILTITPGAMLEIGCANGWLFNWLQREMPHVCDIFSTYLGVDASPKMIEKARERYPQPPSLLILRTRDPRASFCCCDIEKFDTSETFSFVFSMATLYYVSPMEKLSSKIKKLLKPGSALIYSF